MSKAPTHLTVLMVDETPLLTIGEPVTRRRVTIELTEAQRLALTPRNLGVNCGTTIFEMISTTFLEQPPIDGGVKP